MVNKSILFYLNSPKYLRIMRNSSSNLRTSENLVEKMLKILNLTTLEERQKRGDLIQMVVDIWNGLSTRAVNAISFNSFKTIIDRETAKALNGPGAILALRSFSLYSSSHYYYYYWSFMDIGTCMLNLENLIKNLMLHFN
ncbi:hypothetical protein BpHYR1_034887 [Brachionus plicatilis]|uniref:RNA-directed DNA polymerase from mobile element jockey-like n=1 Tax=Brachionus plicatilis TaxID=10195 RepID=A0A3M7TB86_BRAPC|nr:hypothetical protein BpHYR1_034887 [Brachionus plicatilis]